MYFVINLYENAFMLPHFPSLVPLLRFLSLLYQYHLVYVPGILELIERSQGKKKKPQNQSKPCFLVLKHVPQS